MSNIGSGDSSSIGHQQINDVADDVQSIPPSTLDTEVITAQAKHEPSLQIPKASEAPYSIFSRKQIAVIVGLASWSASFSGLSSNIYFPAIPIIASDLNTSPEMINITVTLYLIFQGLSPSLWAPLSDVKGRRVVILITFTLYLAANVGLALTKDYAQLAVLRAVQSSGSASAVAIGSAIVGDVADRKDRAGYMGIFNGASLLATAIGPVIGAAIAQKVNWRNIFWLLVGYGGAFLAIAAIIYPETMRKVVGNGSIVPQSRLSIAPAYSLWVSKADRREASPQEIEESQRLSHFPLKNVFRPILLCRSAKVSLSVSFLALHYAVWQMVLTASSTFFAREYHLNVLLVGVTFLSNGLGCIVASIVGGRILDRLYSTIAKKHAAKQAEKQTQKALLIGRARLIALPFLSIIEVIFVIIFGWSIDKHINISLPIICTFFIASSLLANQVAVSTFLVDSFPDDSGSANATLNLLRCLFAAGGTAAILPMTNAMGTGWAFTFLALLLLASNGLIAYQLIIEKRDSNRSDIMEQPD